MSGSWKLSPDASARERLLRELGEKGFALVDPTEALSAQVAARQPWDAVAKLLGTPAALVERQPIAPVSWGRSFASTAIATPLHSDSQLFAGVPPHLQLMFCERAAVEGGETLLVDTHELLEGIERDDPALFHRLFSEARRIPFVFGDVLGPTVSWRGGSLVFTHSPQPPTDAIGQRLARCIAQAKLTTLRVESGQLLLVDNHRMLHGRTAFSGTSRSFTRLLAWLDRPLSRHARFAALAQQEAARLAATLGAEERRKHGLAAPTTEGTARRRQIVLEMLRGVPPGALAERHGVPEPTLYAWRDAALAGMDRALEDD